MNNHKLLTWVWKLTYDILLANIRNSGLNICTWLSSGSTPLTIQPSKCLHLLPCMVDPHQLFQIILWTPLPLKLWTLHYTWDNKFWNNLDSIMIKSRKQMEIQDNMSRRELTFQIGDSVLFCLRPYHQRTVVKRTSQKLSKYYHVPFTVIKIIGEVA